MRKYYEIDHQMDEYQLETLYQLQPLTNIKLGGRQCTSLAFNEKQTVMMIGQYNQILVFEFDQGQIMFKQQLYTQDYNILMNYLKLSNQFISSGMDTIFQIWGFNEVSNQWFLQQNFQLESQSDITFHYFLMTKEEDTIIVQCYDKIKFWYRKENEQRIIKTINTSCQIMTINQTGDILATSGNRKGDILIHSRKSVNNWKKQQRIQIKCTVYVVCFAGDSILICVMRKDKMCIFVKNESNNLFYQHQIVDLTCQLDMWLQISEYNESKELFRYQNRDSIYLLKKSHNHNFYLKQIITIEKGGHIFGSLSPDGKYLIAIDQNAFNLWLGKWLPTSFMS